MSQREGWRRGGDKRSVDVKAALVGISRKKSGPTRTGVYP